MGRISYKGRLDPQMVAAMQKAGELAPGVGEMHTLPIAFIILRRLWVAGFSITASVRRPGGRDGRRGSGVLQEMLSAGGRRF